MDITLNGTKAAIVKGIPAHTAKQGSDYATGVSAETVGANSIFLGVVTLPPGRRTKAHLHQYHETAMYMIEGDEIDMYSGANLEHHETMHVGDYVYIPANVMHVGVNRSAVPAVFVGTRNEATVNESVVLHPELDSVIP
ncbi:cupin domain-containing protein [Devosia sp. CN2-171]|uniref:cupin domain-containing protein n=1 Tax=Devosia sp. CN2-171 TaxID=3400909 RepID=UPI003BF799F6